MPAFPPKKRLEFVKLDTSRNNMTKTASFIDEVSHSIFKTNGIPCQIYRLEGVFDQDRDVFNIKKPTPEEEGDIGSFLGIQDPVLMENRDRKYNLDDVPVIRGVTTMSPNASELLRFGIKSNEVLNIEFHQTEVEQLLGRRFVIGDLMMIPVFRSVSNDGRVSNKIYEVKDIDWSTGGYDPHFIPHVITVVVQPIRDQWEFRDVLENVKDEYGKSAQEQMSNHEILLSISERLQKMAFDHVPVTGIDETLMYIDPETDYPRGIWSDDGIPPNGEPVRQGTVFPPDASNGDWFLHLGLHPPRLYRFEKNRWRTKEVMTKRDWVYNFTEMLRGFMSDGSEEDRNRRYELKSIHDVLTNREDFSDPSNHD